jgi:4-amino-4-deoxy-L-arabinose transferase-like glycosyltransferase
MPLSSAFKDPVLWLILLAALVSRTYFAAHAPPTYCEVRIFIPAAERISFQPAHVHLPVRETSHPALAHYLSRAGSLVLGRSLFAYRLPGVFWGLATIALIYKLASRWSVPAGRWAAALLAFNEYHLAAATEVMEIGPYLFFSLLAIEAMACFLDGDCPDFRGNRAKHGRENGTGYPLGALGPEGDSPIFAGCAAKIGTVPLERPGWLFLAAASAAAGFYCKELAGLLIPLFALTLLLLPQRRWLLRKEPWLAGLLFFVLLLPDLWHNLTQNPPLTGATHYYGNYLDHFSRIGGIGLNPNPSLFYLGDLLRRLKIEFYDSLAELPITNVAAGAVMLGSAVLLLFRRGKDPALVLSLVTFWGLFGFLSLIQPGQMRREGLQMDPVSWQWADISLCSAVALAAAALSRLSRRWQQVACAAAVIMILWTCWQLWTRDLGVFSNLPPAEQAAARNRK